MTRDNEIFRTDRVTVEFGGLTALKNVSVRVEQGEIRGVIGPNGAGKTTFFNAVTRFVPITSGEVFFEGENITPLPPHAIARKGVIRTFQKRGIISSLTAMENVLTGCHRMMGDLNLFDICFRNSKFRKVEGEGIRRAMNAIEAVGLAHAADQPAGELSFGEQTLIEIAAGARFHAPAPPPGRAGGRVEFCRAHEPRRDPQSPSTDPGSLHHRDRSHHGVSHGAV